MSLLPILCGFVMDHYKGTDNLSEGYRVFMGCLLIVSILGLMCAIYLYYHDKDNGILVWDIY